MRSIAFPALALLAAALATCAPSQHNESVYGIVHVAFGAPLDDAGPWRPDQLGPLRDELAALGALGPTFVETDEGHADLVIRPFDSTAADPLHRPCGAGVGRYHPGSRYAECDPACTHGYEQLQACAGHEAGHYVGMAHVAAPGEACGDCDPRVPAQDAMMNRSIAYDTDPDPSGMSVPVATPTPTSGDLLEFRLTHP